MNNINSTFTSIFLDALAKDKSTVKEMSPIVVFRRVLGLGEHVDTSEVMKSLQRHATSMGKLKEFSSNVISNRFTGEVISFDIGPDPAWAQFKVIREPLPEGKGTAINFVFVVTDTQNLKRWTRLVGTIANEVKDGKNVPVFRLIQDMCNEEDLPKPVKEEDLTPINEQSAAAAMPEPGDPPAEEREPEKPVSVIFHTGDIVITKRDKNNKVAVSVVDDRHQPINVIWEFEDPGENVEDGKYVAMREIVESEESLFDKFTSNFEILEVIGSKEPVIIQHDEPVPEVPPPVFISKDTDVRFRIVDDSVVQIISVPSKDGEEAGCIHEFSDAEFKNFVKEGKIYRVKEHIYYADFDLQASEIAEKFAEVETAPAEESQSETVVPAIDNQPQSDPAGEERVPVVVVKQNELITLEEFPGKKFVCMTKDLTDVEIEEATKNGTLLDLLVEVSKDTGPDFVPSKTKGKLMEEIVIYNEGDEAEFPQAPGKKFKANRKITQQMVTDNKGIMPTEWFDEIVAEVPPAAEPLKPIGEEPVTKKCSEEHTQSEFMNMLFGTPNPSILHVLNLLKKYAGGDEYELTGTNTIERMIAYTDYTFSIVKMKDGAFYRVWVAHTDVERGAKGSWLETHGEQDRWFKIGDVQDREMGRLLNSRR